MRSLAQRLQHLPTPVADAGLAVALAVAITIAIGVSPEPGARQEAAAYALGWTIAALVLVRRRWPLAVLLASAAILQLYYQLDYPGIYPAVPLSAALATAWAAGHRLWSLLVVGFFVLAGIGVGYQTLLPNQPAVQVLGDVMRDTVLFAAVLLLGEAVRTRRALAAGAGAVRAAAAQRAAGPDRRPAQAARGRDRRRLPGGHRPVRRPGRLHPAQPAQQPRSRWCRSSTSCSRPSTSWPSATGWRRSRPSATPTWSPAGCPSRGPTTPRRWPSMALAMREEVARRTDPGGQPLQSASASTPARWWPGSSAPASSATTCGATPSTPPAGWSRTGCPAASRSPPGPTSGCETSYRFQRRGPMPVKGKGEMVSYFLVGRAQ